MADHVSNSLRIVLVGKTGCGKSATANTILGEKKFRSQISAKSVTSECQIGTRDWKGRKVLVVDTPGLFDTAKKLETTCKEISQCVVHSSPGPHAIILVMGLGRYTEEEHNTVSLIKNLFGQSVMKYMILLFTHKDDLDGSELSEFLSTVNDSLRSLIKECDNHIIAFNNSAEKPEQETQVEELIQLVEKIEQKNGGTYFSDHIYEDAEKRIQQCMQELKKMHKEDLQNKIESAKEKYADRQEEKEKMIQSLEKEYEHKINNLREDAKCRASEGVFSRIKNFFASIWDSLWS